MGRRFPRPFRALALLLALAASQAPAAGKPLRQDDAALNRAMMLTYPHGVTDDLARQVVSEGAIPRLFDLLSDPVFPRRDNVVAFLAHRAGASATAHLIAFLHAPPADVSIPEEDRALLLAPQALGRIAARGDQQALEHLLEMTADGSDGGPLAWAAGQGRDPGSLRADLMEMALRGLALSRASRARARLADLASGRVRPDSGGRDLSRPAENSLVLFDEMVGAAPPGRPAGHNLDGAALGGASGGAASGGGLSVTGPVAELADTATSAHQTPLTYANHAAVPSPMDNARLDAVLLDGSLRTGRSDFSADVSCCASFVRSGNAATFGFAGDGLDIIDNSTELSQVLNNSVARVHVVRTINYCGGPGSNIIGCAWVNGNGMSLVRLSGVGSEGILWVHEYGHNVGLSHSTDSRYIMYGTLDGSNNAVSPGECGLYHSPLSGAGMNPQNIGVCADADSDLVQDAIDNCPGQANGLQEDFEADRIGDLCDPDDDNDLVADGADCNSRNAQVWAPPTEALDLDATPGGNGTLLTWVAPATPGAPLSALRYDTIQTNQANNFTTPAICLESSAGPDTSAMTGGAPTPVWATEGNQINVRHGTAVALNGDADNDGMDDVLVGAPQYGNGQDREGRVSYYPGGANGPGLLPIPLEVDSELAKLGSAVAWAGDVDNDGFDDILAGAPGFDNGINFGGAAFLWYGAAGGPQAAPGWSFYSDIFDANVGAAVASAGDVNNDGFDDLLVGAPTYDNGFFNEGRVFLFLGSASGPQSAWDWSASGGQLDARFGTSVASAGDVNNDGFDDVLIGAPQHDNGQSNEGRVYLYLGSAGGLSISPAAMLEIDSATAGLGNSVAGVGDVDGDLFDDILVGASGYENGQNNEGAAFLYNGAPGGVALTPSWTYEGGQADAALGSSVARGGDVSGDGIPDILVGASGYDGDIANEGLMLLFLGSLLGPRPSPDRMVEGDYLGATLGTAVAGGGDVNGDGIADTLAGATLFDNGQTDEGKAIYVPGSAAILPPLNGAFFYLVRAENGCGGGPIGFSSSGSPIAAILCP